MKKVQVVGLQKLLNNVEVMINDFVYGAVYDAAAEEGSEVLLSEDDKILETLSRDATDGMFTLMNYFLVESTLKKCCPTCKQTVGKKSAESHIQSTKSIVNHKSTGCKVRAFGGKYFLKKKKASFIDSDSDGYWGTNGTIFEDYKTACDAYTRRYGKSTLTLVSFEDVTVEK